MRSGRVFLGVPFALEDRYGCRTSSFFSGRCRCVGPHIPVGRPSELWKSVRTPSGTDPWSPPWSARCRVRHRVRVGASTDGHLAWTHPGKKLQSAVDERSRYLVNLESGPSSESSDATTRPSSIRGYSCMVGRPCGPHSEMPSKRVELVRAGAESDLPCGRPTSSLLSQGTDDVRDHPGERCHRVEHDRHPRNSSRMQPMSSSPSSAAVTTGSHSARPHRPVMDGLNGGIPHPSPTARICYSPKPSTPAERA